MPVPGRSEPGAAVPRPPRLVSDGAAPALAALSGPELLELRARQDRLLRDARFLARLPDRGDRIRAFRARIQQRLEARVGEDSARAMLERLSIAPETVQDAEWKGRSEPDRNAYLDSDDDSDPEDVISVLSRNAVSERKVKILRDDKPLITKKDVEDIEDDKETQHITYIIGKAENSNPPKTTGHFKPYRTTKTDVHDPQKEGLRRKHKHWEVTAATPPPIKHGPAQLLSIEESLKLQRYQNQHLKDVETKHAADKLMSKIGFKIGEVPANMLSLGQYREMESEGSEESDNEGSDQEVHDEEIERGGVVFTVMN